MDSSLQFNIAVYVWPLIYVSILVLMDSSLQSIARGLLSKRLYCFNPCFNGFFSSMGAVADLGAQYDCFNPCFNGFFSSMMKLLRCLLYRILVSILVLMDSSLQSIPIDSDHFHLERFNPCFNGFFSSMLSGDLAHIFGGSFNPCFNGFFSSI